LGVLIIQFGAFFAAMEASLNHDGQFVCYPNKGQTNSLINSMPIKIADTDPTQTFNVVWKRGKNCTLQE